MAIIGKLHLHSDSNRSIERPSYSLQIQNIISTADLKQRVKIRRLNDFGWGRFDTENNYNGKVGYVKDDKMQGRVTVFESGKLISTGAKSISQSIEQLTRTKELLARSHFIKKIRLEPKVCNIVATLDTKKRVDINMVATSLPNSIYEPEQFPGLIHKIAGSATCLIFASGKVVIAGAKSEEGVSMVAKDISSVLNDFRV